jgi:hypothetical protein
MATSKHIRTHQENFIRLVNSHKSKRESIDEKIAKLEKKIENLKNEKVESWRNQPHWHSILVPILIMLSDATKDLKWDFWQVSENDPAQLKIGDLHSFGLRNETPVFASDSKGNTVAGLFFTPGNLENGEILIDIAEEKGHYPSKSIGALNNMNKVSVPVTSINQLVKIVREQEKKTIKEIRKGKKATA